MNYEVVKSSKNKGGIAILTDYDLLEGSEVNPKRGV